MLEPPPDVVRVSLSPSSPSTLPICARRWPSCGRAAWVFEEYDEGPFATQDGIVTVDDNYPSKGKGEYGAWFRDCEGNMLGLGQAF